MTSTKRDALRSSTETTLTGLSPLRKCAKLHRSCAGSRFGFHWNA
ncbi:hypothetical protein MCHI_001028 [Candidatus Magnetoovum chiemensis]|nr:hypothetical protein MCHI_001028 [Candidatus Magnetoovum chiemensis]